MGRPLQHTRMISYHVSYHSNTPLPETMIIDLHALFLTKGMHRITVPTLNEGRLLMRDFLYSLHYYQRIGYLTLDAYPASLLDNQTYYDLHALLEQKAHVDEAEIMLELFEFDFFIIEYSDELTSCSWFESLIQTVESGSTPAVIISA